MVSILTVGLSLRLLCPDLLFNFIHHCRSDSKNDNKQTANKENSDTTMTKLPVTHIYSTNYLIAAV